MDEAIPLKIESHDMTVGMLFKEFYGVPEFQREYVWKTEHVQRLLQDLFDDFYDEKGIVSGHEYFLGSIVCSRDADGTFQLIDGQQRITTLFIVLCAIRDILMDLGVPRSKVLDTQISDAAIDPQTYKEVERFHVTLQYEDSNGALDRIALRDVSAVGQETATMRNIFAAYASAHEFLSEMLGDSPGQVREFHGVLTTRVKLIRIVTPTVANALKVFETVNDRGVGLNAMDLLKNLLFMKTNRQNYAQLKTRWKVLLETLHKAKEKPLRFLRYYIMANYEIDYSRGIREDEIYSWFVENGAACGIDSDPLGFVEGLLEAATAHAKFLEFKDPCGQDEPNLRSLGYLGGALRQQYILLMAGRSLPRKLFSQLCEAIEKLFFCYIITREPTKTFERNFARWSADLRTVNDQQSLDEFIRKYFLPDINSRSDRFEFAFRELSQSRIQFYRLRYILAKLTQHVNDSAWNQKTRLSDYIAKEINVEHILPVSPTALVRESFDAPERYSEYVGRLGNLMLLEQGINQAVSNSEFSKKAPGYKMSKFLLTQSLVKKPKVGKDTQINRATKCLLQFDSWDSSAIESRQKMLTALAQSVWGLQEEPQGDS